MGIVTIKEKLAITEKYKRYKDIANVGRALGITGSNYVVAKNRKDDRYSDNEINIVNGVYEIALARMEKRKQNGLN